MKDLYSIEANPQYALELIPSDGPVSAWVQLTRHITDKVTKTSY